MKPNRLLFALGLAITLALGQQLSVSTAPVYAQQALSNTSSVDHVFALRATAVQEVKTPEGGTGLSIVLEPVSAAKLREFSKTVVGKRVVFSSEGQIIAVLTAREPVTGDSLLLTGMSGDVRASIIRSMPLTFDIRSE